MEILSVIKNKSLFRSLWPYVSERAVHRQHSVGLGDSQNSVDETFSTAWISRCWNSGPPWQVRCNPTKTRTVCQETGWIGFQQPGLIILFVWSKYTFYMRQHVVLSAS